MITWFKGLSWIVILGAIGAGVMMILRAYSAGKMEADIAHGQERVKVLIKGTITDIQAAKQLQADITIKKVKARAIRKKSEASLERIGQDETMADIAKRFNGKRVRSRSDTAT